MLSEGQDKREATPSHSSKNALLLAAIMAGISTIASCAHSQATGGNATVIYDGEGEPEVRCKPGTASGPNARAGKGRAFVNGKEIKCP